MRLPALFCTLLLLPATLIARDPVYSFAVELEDAPAGTFSTISEISCEIEVIEYQDGDDLVLRKRPGRAKYGNITLKRGYTAGANDLFTGWQQLARGVVERKSMSVILQNDAGKEAARFEFTNCWPAKWKLSGFDNSTTATETASS